MNHHITPHRIYASDWEFVRSYRPRRTAFGYLLTLVAVAVVILIGWLIINDPDVLRLGLVVGAVLALWMMAKGART